VIGYNKESGENDWIILSGRGVEFGKNTNMLCCPLSTLVEPPSTSLLTNQQFINCAFLERSLPF